MKNKKLKQIKLLDKKYPVLEIYKQEISPVAGILFPLKDFDALFNKVIKYDEIFAKDEEEQTIAANVAYETTYLVNMITKSYLMYLMSHIESKLRTFFINNLVDVLEKDKPDTTIADIEDDYWIDKFFKSKSRFGNIKHRYKLFSLKKSPREFFHNLTFGEFVFILTRMNDKLLINFFTGNESVLEDNVVYNHISGENAKDKKINTFMRALKVTKEFRNHIIHKTLVIDPELIELVADIEKPTYHLGNHINKSNYIFNAIDLTLADIGYNYTKMRLSRHIDRELKDKNKIRQSKKKEKLGQLSMENIDISGFYQKK